MIDVSIDYSTVVRTTLRQKARLFIIPKCADRRKRSGIRSRRRKRASATVESANSNLKVVFVQSIYFSENHLDCILFDEIHI